MNIFGTDGIRSLAGTYPLNINFLIELVPALLKTFPNTKKIILAQDTRLSGPMLNNCLASIFSSYGISVINTNIMPTPSLPTLIKSTKANLGIMISASHNPFEDNGIKIFNQNGLKLTTTQENLIESNLSNKNILPTSTHDKIGQIIQKNLKNKYIKTIINQFENLNLSNLKIAVDTANGAMSHIAPNILKYFGATVAVTANKPNGININHNCGVTHPNNIANFTKLTNSNIGLSFDGDGDRLAICDEYGNPVHGDHLLGFLASNLNNINSVAITIMSNLALENFLSNLGKSVIRTPVGDKFIAEQIINNNAQFGGESSGHIIIQKYSNTGDGLIAALALLSCLSKSQQPISKIIRPFQLTPFVQKNIKVNNKNIAESPEIKNLIQKYSNPNIRIILRKSGTENLIRILVEGQNQQEILTIQQILENKLIELQDQNHE